MVLAAKDVISLGKGGLDGQAELSFLFHLLPDGKPLLLFAPVSSVTFPGDFLAASRLTLLVF